MSRDVFNSVILDDVVELASLARNQPVQNIIAGLRSGQGHYAERVDNLYDETYPYHTMVPAKQLRTLAV